MKRGHVPIRTCVGCRTKRPKSEMIRLVAGSVDPVVRPEGGRGLYLCPDVSCAEKGLMRDSVKKRLGASGCADLLRVLSTLASGENCLDGTYPGRVICDQCHGGGPFG